uniref:Glial cells missing transcription factor n=1 Tax=Echinocardium cordatum TaxID=39298 RepID=A0A0P0UPF6_ECHCD|nr:glial cells missing transcription factor [Echinocardium cordatum]
MEDHLESGRLAESDSKPTAISTPKPVINQALLQPHSSPPLLHPSLPLPLLPVSSTPQSVSNSIAESSKPVVSSQRSSTRTSSSTSRMVQKVTPKHEIVSAAAAAACVTGAPGTMPKSSASTRWSEKRGRSKGDRDEWKKLKKMKIEKYDEFCEWIDGDATMRYRPKDIDARKHLSGWAMRNTNNHNKKVLKKSCLGVFLCSKGCQTASGEFVSVRPATSDRARKKQGDKKCPRTGCDGKLFHQICAGKSGYPVTHFWRVTDTVILFQAKGVHDHPRPDVVKTTSQAKMALLEYHRMHRHERPKEICKKVGVHIHKSFSRVDRVARQLREVQGGDGTETVAELPNMPKAEPTSNYSLRSHARAVWNTTTQRQNEAENHHYVTGQGNFAGTYNTRQGYNSYYPTIQPQGADNTWSQYTGLEEYASTAFQSYRPAETHQPVAAYHPSGYPFNPPVHSSDPATYDYNFGGNAAMTTPVATAKLHEGMDMGLVHSEEVRPGASMYHGYPVEFASMLTNQTTAIDQPQMTTSYVSSDMTSPQQGHVMAVKQPIVSPLKRPAPPDLHSLQEAKQPRLSHDQTATRESSTIKLSDHTPTINIDLSNFSDIFDIPSGLGEEGLAGRPKTPVYQSLSPAVPKTESDAAAAGAPSTVSQIAIFKDELRNSPVLSEDGHHNSSVVVDSGSSSVGSPASSVCSHATATPPQVQSPPHPPVLTTLSTHSHTGAPTTAAPGEDGGFLEQLVSMYLPKEEKPISKNEFQVYTDSQTGNRTYGYRHEDMQYHPQHHGSSLEHMLTSGQQQRVPTHSTHHEENFYDRNQVYRNTTAAGPVTESLISPLMSAGHFDYTTSITDYYNSQLQAAAASTTSTAGVVSTSDSPLSAFTPSYQTSLTPSTSTVFGHMTNKYLL